MTINNVEAPCPAPKRSSPHAAAFASFSRMIGRSMNFRSSLSRFTPFHAAMFGVANMVLRSEETKPAADKPMLSTANSSRSSLATSAMVSIKCVPPSRGVSLLALLRTFPFSSTTPPRTLVPPISIPIVCNIRIRGLCALYSQ